MDAVLQKRLVWALFVLLISTLMCCQPTELIWGFLFHTFSIFPPPPPKPLFDPVRWEEPHRHSGRPQEEPVVQGRPWSGWGCRKSAHRHQKSGLTFLVMGGLECAKLGHILSSRLFTVTRISLNRFSLGNPITKRSRLIPVTVLLIWALFHTLPIHPPSPVNHSHTPRSTELILGFFASNFSSPQAN